MKNYNKILEAVNRGIQLALDDFGSEEQVQHVKNKQVNHNDYTKEYLDLMEVAVDLGLPSGTLWCKYNLGVDSNQLLTPNDWYGKYYAWGELEEKTQYIWSNYKYGKDDDKLTKYCNDPKYGLNGFTDNLTKLQSEDDVVYQKKTLHNYKFHIPSKEQFEELLNYTNSYWVKNYNPNKIVHNSDDDEGIQGLNGRIFEGKNGNQLFIPATGFCYGSNINGAGFHCYSWSSSLNFYGPCNAYRLYFNSGYIIVDHCYRYFGYCIRPVVNL